MNFSVWPLIWQYGIGAVAIAALLAIAFFTTFKKTSLAIAAGVAIWLAGVSYGDNIGATRIKLDWKDAEQNALDAGIDARRAAELAIPPVDPDEHPLVGRPPDLGPRPCVVPDKFDRDCK